MTDQKFSITFDLSEPVFAKLLSYCQKEGKPVGEVAPKAIAHYLRQMEIHESLMTKELSS